MKKIIFSILSIIIGFFGFTFADLEFANYKVLGQIQNDGTIDVQEHIAVHFFDQMHGIERIIPWTYTVQDTEFQVFIDNINVPDYNYKIIDDYYDTNIRIGNADVYVDGDKNYEIDYSIYGLIRNFSGMGYSELYRNVIGYSRSNDIDNVQIELTLPKPYNGLKTEDFLITAGYSDKTSIDDFDGEVRRDANKIYITYNKKLYSYNGITLAIRFPSDYFEFDHEKQRSLLVGYTHDYNIESYKLFGTLEKSGNIVFHNDIELEILNETPYVWGKLPYKYQMDNKSYLTQLRNVSMNGEEKDIEMYDTTNSYTSFKIPGDFDEVSAVSADYSVYGLVRPFSGEYEDWAYRLYLPLPILDLGETVKNFELLLDVPGGCDTVYQEDITVNIGGDIIGLSEYNEKYGHIWCHDNKFAMTFSGEIDYGTTLGLYVNFVKGSFELDEALLAGLAAVGDGQFYYTNKINWQSILFAIGILLYGGGFNVLMKRRYDKKARKNEKYPIQYDAPKGVDSSEAGVLIDNKVDPKDLTALIYQRAINRYIKIFAEDDNSKKFYIKKLKDLPLNTKKYQLNLFNSLFKDTDEFHFANNHLKFSDYLSTANKELVKYIDSQKRYKTEFFSGIGNSFKRQTLTLVFWVAVLGFIPYFSVVTLLTSYLIPTSNFVKIACFISFVLIVISYRNYKAENNTLQGQDVRNHCLGFKDFLLKVDKEKLEMLLKQDALYIEKVLPYAVVFGVYSDFIKKITPDMVSDLDFIDGEFDYLLNSINYISRQALISFAPMTTSSYGGYSSSGGFSSGSSFGGGYSSGGGGGGGGGGGW